MDKLVFYKRHPYCVDIESDLDGDMTVARLSQKGAPEAIEAYVKRRMAMRQWCEDALPEGMWEVTNTDGVTFSFAEEKHAILFKLRWEGEENLGR